MPDGGSELVSVGLFRFLARYRETVFWSMFYVAT